MTRKTRATWGQSRYINEICAFYIWSVSVSKGLNLQSVQETLEVEGDGFLKCTDLTTNLTLTQSNCSESIKRQELYPMSFTHIWNVLQVDLLDTLDVY